MLAAATGASAPRLQTTIFDAQEKAADEQVNRIIAANIGKAAARTSTSTTTRVQ